MRKWPHHANNSTCNRASTHGIHGSPGCHSHNHFRLSTVRFLISNCELSCISIFVGGNILNCSPVRTPSGSPFHECYRVEMVLEGTSMPSGLFFLELSPLTNHEVYVLRVCSLLVIPLPIGRAVPQGGFPTNLVQINLSDWASLVQDVAASLQALPPRLSNCLDPKILNLLHRLEVVTKVKFCCLCYYPGTNCRCAGVPPMTPPTSWSQIMEQWLLRVSPWEVCLD